MSLLVLCKILRLFVNILTVDDKYSLLNRGNLTQPIQIIVSQKQKFFSQFFSEYLKSTLNCKHFQKKWWSSKPIYFWNYGLRKMWLDKCLKSPVLEDLFEKQHVKWTQTLLYSGRHYLYYIYWSLWR